jgi:flagellar hook-length control protein FliK
MVASDLPNTAPQLTVATQGAAPSAVSGNSDTATAGGNADFVSLLTQLLGGGPSAPTTDAAAAVKNALDNDTEDTADELDSGATALEGAGEQVTATVLPVIAEIAQALGTERTVGVTDGHDAIRAQENIPEATATAIVANAQLQAAAMASEARAVSGAGVKAASDAQVQLSQAQQLQVVAESSADGLTDTTDSGDDKAGKQDGNAGNWNAAVNANTAQTQNVTARTELHVQSHVGSPAWRDEIGAKLTWMIDRGMQQGTLRLSPESLGPMEVRITTQNDQVSVWFGAAHADTRTALENALPRLREMFAAQGMSLTDAGVFREPPKDMPRAYTVHRGDGMHGAEVEQGVAIIGSRNALLDTYA